VTDPAEESEHLSPWGHLRCLLTLGLTCLYLAWRPPEREWALAFALAPFVIDLLALRSPPERRQPRPNLPRGAFQALVYLMFCLQWLNLGLAADLLSRIELASPQALAALLLLSLSSSLAAGAAGHELIHRRSRLDVTAGRVLLASMFYEHLYTEHLRGHHARAGTPEDPTTARLGESLLPYLWRAIPGQVSSAWRLEGARLAGRGALARLALNRVLHGFLLELGLIGLFYAAFGERGALAFVVQGVVANLLFQIVNYFQHWGVTRDPSDPAGIAWDTTNGSSLLSMVGLARHTDHHLQPGRPFQELRGTAGANELPGGYGTVIFLAVFRNRRFRELMTAELRRRGRLPAEASPAPEPEPESAPQRSA
jgi:alkane 1-monooxygenase